MKIKKILAAVIAAATLCCGVTACNNTNSDSSSDSSSADSSSSSTANSSDGAQSSDNTSSTDSTPEKANVSVGVIKQMTHDALDKAEEGFIKALDDQGYKDGANLTLDRQNGQGETPNLTTIADQFVGNNVDLIFAIGTKSAQACLGKTQTIPIIGTAITDFVDAGLVDSNENPGTNVSGTTDMNPIEDQVDLLLELFPDVKTIGTVYTGSEDNSVLQANILKECVEGKGLTYTEKTIINTNDIQQAVSSIITECDALYIGTDNNMASAMALVSSICNPAKIPVICGESGMVENGGFGTLSIDYYQLGYQAGLMAVRVLEGEDISKMPIEKSTEFAYCFNKDAVEALGYTLPDKYADFVVETKAAE